MSYQDLAIEDRAQFAPHLLHRRCLVHVFRPDAMDGDVAGRKVHSGRADEPTVFRDDLRIAHDDRSQLASAIGAAIGGLKVDGYDIHGLRSPGGMFVC